MDVEVGQRKPIPPHQPPPREVPFPFLERLIVGTLGGVGAAILAAWIAFDVAEVAAIGVVILAPVLAVLGGICGVISWSHGWAAVRPMVWALSLGVLLHVDQPAWWILGGALGGAVNGLLRSRSVKGIAKASGRGILLGLIGWWVTIGYFLTVIVLLCWLAGD
jgi:hypothetical protein